jgi:hypothetical protein
VDPAKYRRSMSSDPWHRWLPDRLDSASNCRSGASLCKEIGATAPARTARPRCSEKSPRRPAARPGRAKRLRSNKSASVRSRHRVPVRTSISTKSSHPEHTALRSGPTGLRAVVVVELLEMGPEVGAALGGAGMDSELEREVIERAQHRHHLGLSRCRDAQVGAGLPAGARKIGMRQLLLFVAVEKNDVACFGLTLAQLQAQADPIQLASGLAPLQRVLGPPPTELFFATPWTIATGRCSRPYALRSRRAGGNRPFRPVGYRQLKQERDHAQRRFALQRHRPRRYARPQRIHIAAAKIAAPEPERVLPVRQTLPRSADCSSRTGLAAPREPGPLPATPVRALRPPTVRRPLPARLNRLSLYIHPPFPKIIAKSGEKEVSY